MVLIFDLNFAHGQLCGHWMIAQVKKFELFSYLAPIVRLGKLVIVITSAVHSPESRFCRYPSTINACR